MTATNRVAFRAGNVSGVCRMEIREVLCAIYREFPWVYDCFISRKTSREARGRRPVMIDMLAGRAVLVKRLAHGGLLARVTGDRFLTTRRVSGALAAEDYLGKKGVRTAETAFAAWRRVAGFVRCEVGVWMLEAGKDASDYLFPETGDSPADWADWCRRVGKFVRRLHEIDFIHPDLNLMNLYFTREKEIVMLDLDKSSPPMKAADDGAKQKNLARLLRSVRKEGRQFPPRYIKDISNMMMTAYRG